MSWGLDSIHGLIKTGTMVQADLYIFQGLHRFSFKQMNFFWVGFVTLVASFLSIMNNKWVEYNCKMIKVDKSCLWWYEKRNRPYCAGEQFFYPSSQFLVEFLNPCRPIRSTRKIDVLHATVTLLSQPSLALTAGNIYIFYSMYNYLIRVAIEKI